MVGSLFDFEDYREFLNAWIQQRGKTTRGIKSLIAEKIGVSTTMISLVLSGSKNLSHEQTIELCEFMGLNDSESDYFFLLVDLARAGSHKLEKRLRQKIAKAQMEAQKISKRVPKGTELTEQVKAVFYSNWVYVGILNLIAVDGFDDVNAIAQRLGLSLAVVVKNIEFLLENGLCIKKDGKLQTGPAFTHLDADSPFVFRHHQNWRLRGFHFMEQSRDSNLFFTGPVSLSAEAAKEIRSLLPNYIEKVMKIVGPSPSEKVYCLNIDWFEY